MGPGHAGSSRGGGAAAAILLPMSSITDALRAGRGPAHRRAVGERVLVAGGGGLLGAAVLEQVLGSRAFVQVSVLVAQPMNAALPGLTPVLWAPGHSATGAPPDETALVVFDRARHANGRELAFVRPEPAQLPALAAWLKARGVRRLLLVMPHAPASLPQALKAGLASLDEQAVAQLGFDHLVFVRSAQAPDAVRSRHLLQRVADWVLSQAQLMVPVRDKPVQAAKVARLVALIAAGLRTSPPGTRVVPPELVWEAAQSTDLASFVREWLAGHATPEAAVPVQRM